jgi:hypothetical protein
MRRSVRSESNISMSFPFRSFTKVVKNEIDRFAAMSLAFLY